MGLDEKILYANRTLSKVPTAKASKPPANFGQDRRRAVRARFPEPCAAQLQMRDATLVNISRFGVLAEHEKPAWPGQVYHLSFTVQGTQVRLMARAVHAFASNRHTAPGGEGQVVFRTGLEFVAVERDAGDFLSAYVDGLRQEEKAEG